MAPSIESAQLYRACRHLLRHIGNGRALAANPLVASVLAEFRREKVTAVHRRTADHVLNVLRSVANELPERQRVILTCCDLERQSHKSVASDLALSMRQFYRERQALIEALADILPERMRTQSSTAANVVDVCALELARARALQYGGEPDAASASLRSIAQTCEEPRVAIDAWAQLTSLLITHSRFAEARLELNAMRAYSAQAGVAQAEMDWCTQRIALERRYLLECSGAQREARDLDEGALSRIDLLLQAGDPAARELAVHILTGAARRNFMCGAIATAKHQMERVSDLASSGGISAESRINWSVLYGVVLTTMRCENSLASSLLVEAGSIAVRHGLSELALMAAVGRSIDDEMRGAPPSAQTLAHSILPLAKKAASPLNYVHVCLRLASLEVTRGNPQSALYFLDESRAQITYGCYNWVYAELLTAQARLLAGNATYAQTHAEQAAVAAAKQQNLRVRGIALRVLAETHAALNEHGEAIQCIEQSISCLESHGYPLALFHAYRVAAALTGRTRYRRWSVELEQLLRPA